MFHWLRFAGHSGLLCGNSPPKKLSRVSSGLSPHFILASWSDSFWNRTNFSRLLETSSFKLPSTSLSSGWSSSSASAKVQKQKLLISVVLMILMTLIVHSQACAPTARLSMFLGPSPSLASSYLPARFSLFFPWSVALIVFVFAHDLYLLIICICICIFAHPCIVMSRSHSSLGSTTRTGPFSSTTKM